MAHKFNPKDMQRLDSPERRKILPPEETLNMIGVTNNDIFIDIGCGIGYFSIPASKSVGIKGKVYALDTSSEMIQELERRISENKITNIETIISDPYDFKLNSDIGTFAFMANVLHEIDEKEIFLKETYRVLKKEGTLCIIEWQKKETERGPPLEERLSNDEIKELLKITDFKLNSIYPIGEFFIAYLSKKI
ncbi:MAG: tRNA wyosine derivatives biosynthesis protein Taw2 [Candidatus Methanofastidiosum methylothiophilum]|uniref:tRNA wyosine derivatives biosynthesis protein Taw2 n=1 Tax=Candidatus Methanofastidiosum methylothiophilum TaxID=1705564 RepID=A0A150J4D8_9EURY|nr:MAG: tRNA wyosine derivatives biosynthesis protein Taw2 [Candidatus Methanofastidiosum methylthiophilus]NMC76361.1 methyltransferase domain-containing protein [Candidatus Methanofastidiosa archaeon]